MFQKQARTRFWRDADAPALSSQELSEVMINLHVSKIMQRLEDVIDFRNVPTNESMLSDAAGLKMHVEPELSTRKRTITIDNLHISNR